MIGQKKHYDWFESFGRKTAVLKNFNYKELPEDYRRNIRSGIMDSTMIFPSVGINQRNRILKFYKTKRTVDNKDAIVIMNCERLMRRKYNPHREGDEDYYIKQMHNIWTNKSDVKIPLPLIEFDYKGNYIVTEGNHRVKAAFLTKYTVERIACRLRYYTRLL